MLILIGEEETEDIEYGGATLKVGVRSGTWWDDLRDACTTDGRIDQEKYTADVKTGVLLGWSGIGGADGVEIPYSKERVVEVYDALPEDLQEMIFLTAKARKRKYQDALGNS